MKKYLQETGAEVKGTEWRLGNYVVPQLHVTSPADFVMQLEDEVWIIEEAEEFSQRAPAPISERLSICDARLSFGEANDENAITTDQGIVVATDWSTFDPEEPQARILLEALARMVDGLLEDNVSGTWWAPT
ncbi:hypothetical protein PAE61_09830 [Paracoccus aerodenitrificans]|nr:hypothetical protein PAE61_09830 [Paracoccus aerodenitrificans]